MRQCSSNPLPCCKDIPAVIWASGGISVPGTVGVVMTGALALAVTLLEPAPETTPALTLTLPVAAGADTVRVLDGATDGAADGADDTAATTAAGAAWRPRTLSRRSR